MGTTVIMVLDKLRSKRPIHLNILLYIREVDNHIKMHTEEILVCLHFITPDASLNSL